MAKNFLEKLSVLVQASIRDAVGTASGRLSRKQLGSNMDKEIQALREQLETAYADEDQMKRELDQLQAEILRWDEQADTALLNNREAEAHQAIEKMEKAKRQLTILQSELDRHRYAAQELLRQVNQLEGLVERSKQQATESPDSPHTDQEIQTAEPSLSEAIRQARESTQVESSQLKQETEANRPASEGKTVRVQVTDVTPLESDDIQDDIAARRSRLKKPDS